MAFFFTNYVVKHSTSNIKNSEIVGNLHHSMKAVGLVGLLESKYAPTVMAQAKMEYLKAIQCTNQALSSPVDAKKDSTLLGIILLSIFEAISGGSQKSLAAWEHHLNGAATLLKLRGTDQIHTIDGRRLFRQITSSLVTSCIKHKTALPDYITALSAEASQYADPGNMLWRVHEAMISFTSFRARVHYGVLSAPDNILREAFELEASLLSILSKPPPAWRYEVIQTKANPDVIFAGYYHVYGDFLATQCWNAIRSMRMLLHHTILDASQSLIGSDLSSLASDHQTTQVEHSTRMLVELQSDILASVPQHIGYFSRTQLDEFSEPRKSLWSNFEHICHDPILCATPSSAPTLPEIRISGGYTLLWHVWVAGQSRITTPEARQWIVAILRKIGFSTGVRQASVLADLMEKGQPWSVQTPLAIKSGG